MEDRQPIHPRAGFTLIEVLASLGLCALLATATASAIAFAARAEQMAARDGEASLLLPRSTPASGSAPTSSPPPPPAGASTPAPSS